MAENLINEYPNLVNDVANGTLKEIDYSKIKGVREITWNKVKEKINEEIDADYEIIELSKMKIPMCTGCFNCILKSEEKCPHYESIKYIKHH